MAITLVHDCDIERRADPTALGGDFRDTYFQGFFPDSNYGIGTNTVVGVEVPGGKGSEIEYRALYWFDLKAFIPASATITAAVWWLYVISSDALAGHSFRLQRIRRNVPGGNEWVEDEVTWNDYKSGSAWAAPGASDTTNDRDTTVAVGLGAITTAGWKNYDILSLVSDAWSNRNGICTFIFERNDPFMTAQGMIKPATKEYRVFNLHREHHLRITYTLDGRTFQVMVR